MSSGNKYHKELVGVCGSTAVTDVYRVLTAFGNPPPAIQHAIKKLLCAGQREKGDEEQDLREAVDAIEARLLEMEQTV